MEKTENKVVDLFKKCSIVLDEASESSKTRENISGPVSLLAFVLIHTCNRGLLLFFL